LQSIDVNMHAVLNSLVIGAFFSLPVIVLWTRWRWSKRMPWWAVVLAVVAVGWPLTLAGAVLNETPDRGAPMVFALYFGWLYSLLWFLPWLLVYGIFQFVRRRVAPRNLRSAA